MDRNMIDTGGLVNGLRADLHEFECPGMDEDGNWLGPCDCAEEIVWITLTLEIENHYEEIETVTRTVEVTVPPPPLDEDSDEHAFWRDEHILPHTGTGHVTGNSSYFVEVTATSDPDVIAEGTEWEWC